MNIVPKVKEFIHGNIYYRETELKAGTLIVGCQHKKDSIGFLLKGSMKLIDGDNQSIVYAPSVIKTTSDSRRLAYALEDLTYSTTTFTDSNDLENIEYEMFEEISINKFVRDDFNTMLIGYGLSNDDIGKDMESVGYVEIESDLFEKDESGIDGIGVFTKKRIDSNQIIGYAIEDGNKTTLGRFVNHSPIPNSRYETVDGKLALVSLCDLDSGTELTVNYRETLDCIFGGK